MIGGGRPLLKSNNTIRGRFMQLKIGVLIKEFDTLSNWELRTIDRIIKDPSLELVLLIQDARKGNEENSIQSKSGVRSTLKPGNLLARLLLRMQSKVETAILSRKQYHDKDRIVEELKKVNTLKLRPHKEGFSAVFSAADTVQIENFKLDLILKFGFNSIQGAILEVANYGIWSFDHTDNDLNRGGPSGFWEIVIKKPTVSVTLHQLTPELDRNLVIDKAFINYHWSMCRTRERIFETSISLLFKNIGKLQHGEFSPKNSLVYYNPLNKVPNFSYAIKYVVNFYRKILNMALNKVKYKVVGIRSNCWTLFIGKGEFLTSDLPGLKPVEMPKKVFWADPFIFSYKGENYVFFENLHYDAQIGKISCGRITEELQVVDVVDVLVKDYHLSYPYIFEENGEVYLMPETNANKRLELYKCVSFPTEWELYSTAFEGEHVADASFYEDTENNKWLFLNKWDNPICSSDSELYIYKVDSLKMEKLEPHKQNPVLINSEVGRNGGAIFHHEGNVYRPSQQNVYGIYGRGLNLNKIVKLTLDEYVEETVVTVAPNFKKGLNAVHHVHQTEDLFVIDAAYKSM